MATGVSGARQTLGAAPYCRQESFQSEVLYGAVAIFHLLDMRTTTKRTVLFRQNVNRTNAEWARFLENYRDDLIALDQHLFGDDWHTAEDVVYEIFLEIIRNPHITNLRPQDTFRHTLIVLLKQKHRSVTKPWRKALMQKMATWLHLMRPERDDPRYEAALGYADLVVANLMDESQDGGRPYKTYTLKDLERWRCRQAAEPDATGASVAREQRISEATLSASCKKVNDDIAATVREIMSKRGLV